MYLSIIIINYKSAALVLNCLESIYQQTHQYSFEVIVVDNDSQDDCRERIFQKYEKVYWLQMGYNAGFARANNAGINISSGEFILLLNADTIILDGAIDKSIKLLQQQKDAVGCGVQLLNTDGSNQISGARNSLAGLNTLLPLPYLGNLIRFLGYRFNSAIPSVEHVNDKIEVDWIVGAFILIRKTVLLKSGLLDEDFFMYIEELEWCGRLKKHGKLYLFADPKVIHLLGGTSNDFYSTTEKQNSKNIWNKKGRQIIVSNLLRTRKQFGIGWFLLFYCVYVFEIPAFLFCLIISKIIMPKRTPYSWNNFKMYVTNIWILSGYFPKMLCNKPHFYKVP